MDIRRPVFLKRWPQNVAIISNKYVAVISDKYVAVISDKYVTVILDKYVAVISDKYEAIISDEQRHKNLFFFVPQLLTISEQKLSILRQISLHYCSLRNLYVINWFDFDLCKWELHTFCN